MKRVVGGLILIIVVFCTGVAYGLLSHQFQLFPFFQARDLYLHFSGPKETKTPPGNWRPVDSSRTYSDRTQKLIEGLQAIGYVTGSRSPGNHTGVTALNTQSTFPGFNLHCSGHAAEAFLTRLDGEVVHRWRYDFSRVWPDRHTPDDATGPDYWRRIHLYSNGDLLAIFEGFGLIKIDKDSNLIWALEGGYHHDMEVSESGDIWILDREAHVVPRINSREPILEDFIAVVNPRGEVLRRFSILQAFERSPYAPLLHRMEKSSDIFHTNTLEILDGSASERSPFFREGNVLLSVLMLETIAIIDVETESIVWALTGKWRGQHDPTFLPMGNVLLFNNKAAKNSSQVMEFDPLTQQVVWSYEGNAESPFYTEVCGSNQRLPNGNTLITESDAGRAFEVTPNKEIVWEFINPQRAGEDDEFIALLPEVVRLPTTFPLDWLE